MGDILVGPPRGAATTQWALRSRVRARAADCPGKLGALRTEDILCFQAGTLGSPQVPGGKVPDGAEMAEGGGREERAIGVFCQVSLCIEKEEMRSLLG